MNALFRGGSYLKVISRDGRNCGLLENKEVEVEEDDGAITRYLMVGDADTGDTDGASNPYFAQVISHLIGLNIDPYGDYWPAAVWHDLSFRGKLMQWVGGTWIKVTRGDNVATGQMSLPRANIILKALMFGLGTDQAKATVIYEALVLFGKKAWDEDANNAS